jgi:hypothetical protein
MSDGKGGRGGEDAEKTKGRKGSTSKDSLIATTKTPTAALKDSKTPRTPEAHALRDRAVVDAAARQASMGNPGMLENLQSYIDNTPGKLRQPVNTEEVKALVSEFRDQMSKSPAVPATAMPDLLERLAHQRERPEDEDFEDDDSLYNEGLQLALEASNLEIAQLRAQVAGYHDLQKQSFLEVFPDPTEVPKSTKAAANKNGKVLPKKRSSSPPPLETITHTRVTHLGHLSKIGPAFKCSNGGAVPSKLRVAWSDFFHSANNRFRFSTSTTRTSGFWSRCRFSWFSRISTGSLSYSFEQQ